MKKDRYSRRSFLLSSSLVAAGGVVTAQAQTAERTAPIDTSTILNYNPTMRYRRLGKTGLMISEISIGGHWKNRNGGRVWVQLANDEVPEDVAANRTEVISQCIERGMNYLDITTAAECLSYGAALKGRRDRMYVAADDSQLCPRQPENRTVEKQLKNVDECLRRLSIDYLDVWRPQFRQAGGHEDSDVEICIEAFEIAHKQGKVRWLGMSSHNRSFIQHVIEKYSEFAVVVFPFMAKSKVRTPDIASIDATQIEEIGAGDGAFSGDVSKSIFDVVQAKDIGVITIKPFGGGSLFRSRAKFGESVASETDDERARLTLAYILCNNAISATVPGMTTSREVDNNVRASAERLALLDQNGIWKLCESTEQMWNSLPEDYCWLREWEWV